MIGTKHRWTQIFEERTFNRRERRERRPLREFHELTANFLLPLISSDWHGFFHREGATTRRVSCEKQGIESRNAEYWNLSAWTERKRVRHENDHFSGSLLTGSGIVRVDMSVTAWFVGVCIIWIWVLLIIILRGVYLKKLWKSSWLGLGGYEIVTAIRWSVGFSRNG